MPEKKKEGEKRRQDRTAEHWFDSVLVGPQTAGIPTAHDEGYSAGHPRNKGTFMRPERTRDKTGGALDYNDSQRSLNDNDRGGNDNGG